MRRFILLILLGLSQNLWAQASTDATRAQITSMLEGFRQDCSVGGGNVSQAITMVRQLADSLAAAAADDRCKGLSTVMTSLNATATGAQSLYPSLFERDFKNDKDIRVQALQRRKQEILFLLSQATDATEISNLKYELMLTSGGLEEARGEAEAVEANEKMVRRSRALGMIAQNTYQALDTILSNEQCLLVKPQLLETVSGFSVGIANSVSLLSPVGNSAALVGWGTGLIGKLISFFKQKSVLAKNMKFETDLLPIYMACTLEKLNQMYCAADDVQKALDRLKEASAKVSPKDPIWAGSDILKRDLPLAIDWLNRLRTGGAAAKASDSADTNYIDLLEFYLKASLRYAEGRVNEYKTNFKNTGDRKAMWSDLRSVAFDITSSTCPSGNGNPLASAGNPICEFVGGDQLRFYLTGITDTASYRYLQGTLGNRGFSDYRDPDEILQLLEKCRAEKLGCTSNEINYQPMDVLRRFTEVHTLGMSRFKIYKERAASGDLLLIFASASPGSQAVGQNKHNPLVAWENIEKFLNQIEDGRSGRQLSQIGIREDVMRTIRLVVDKIRCVKKKECEASEARDEILEATRILKDSTELNNRIVYLVKTFVDFNVYRNFNSADNWSLQYLASRDFLEEMQSFYTTTNTKISVRDNVSAVQATVVTAYSNFKANFGDILKQSLQTLDAYRSLDQRPFRNLKTFLCYQTLSLGWDNGFQTCLKMVAEPAVDGGYVAPIITQGLYQTKDMSSRACVYRNYLRKNAILEQKPR